MRLAYGVFALLFISQTSLAAEPPSRAELLKTEIEQLVKMQEPDGQWAYEGVYRVGGQIPVGYRIGGTAIVADTLLHAVPDDPTPQPAPAKAIPFVLKHLDDPLMVPSTKEGYDVRVWGHGFALEFFCRLRAAKAMGDHVKAIE